MNKALLAILAFMVICTFPITRAGDAKYTLADDAVNVPTNNGNITLYAKMAIGGDPIHFIWIIYNITLNTTIGPVNFPNYTKVDCDFELPPGYPDPCNPYS